MIDPSAAVRQGLLALSRSDSARRVVERVPVSRSVVRRLVAGDTAEDGIGVAADLVADGLLASLVFLSEDVRDVAQATHTRDEYLSMLRELHECGLSADGAAEVSIKLSALGRELPEDGAKIALDNARQICEAAARAGTTVTVATEDHTTVDSTLSIVRDLRADFPWVGAVLLADLRRTEADCRDLATEGSRVRLCKGGGSTQAVAYQDEHEVDLSYVRCAKVLLAGKGYPMIATHDPAIIDITRSLADKELRAPDSFEFQMFFGVRADEQSRLAQAGHRMRVYLPYGSQWYPYVMHRLAEHPTGAVSGLRKNTRG